MLVSDGTKLAGGLLEAPDLLNIVLRVEDIDSLLDNQPCLLKGSAHLSLGGFNGARWQEGDGTWSQRIERQNEREKENIKKEW